MEDGRIQIREEDYKQKLGHESLIPLLPPGRFYLRPFMTGALWGEDGRGDPSERVFRAGPGARRLSSSFKRAVRQTAVKEESPIDKEDVEEHQHVHPTALLPHALAA